VNVLKENVVKQKIRDGKVVLGTYCDPLNTALIELYGEVGYDFVVLDTEHGPYYGVAHCVHGVKTAEVAGVIPFIRVSHNHPILIQKALEIGAYGVWVPHVETEAECQRAVQAAKYPPVGVRGAGGKAAKQWKFVNDNTMVTVLPLESKKAIENIDRTLSVEGLDMISLSVGDITFALGYPGQPMHPEVVKVRDQVWELCQEQGVAAYVLGSFELLDYYYRKGVRVFMSSVNMRRALQEHMKKLRRLLTTG
jgi:2-keto-3-deoxy-L-rhamnonate aldolase RhmA